MREDVLGFASPVEVYSEYCTCEEDKGVTSANPLVCQHQVAPSCQLKRLQSFLAGSISIPRVNKSRASYVPGKRTCLTKKIASAAIFADICKVIGSDMSIKMYWLQSSSCFEN